jgi:pimeloyl-ACP methyl ester carboxylesterase
MPTVETRTITAPDGRALTVELAGDPGGLPILVHNGTPNSRHLFGPWIEDAARHGIRLIGYDRPGYGGSTAQPARTVADCADDVRAIARALDVQRLGVWGASGGGPHALACAALLPDLVAAVSALCSIAPYGEPGLDYFAGMGEDNADDIRLYLADPVTARQKSREDRVAALQRTPAQLGEGLKTLLSPVDAAVLVDDLAEWMVRCTTDGLATSDEGWWEDGVAHLSPWGFELDAIRTPVQVWHGRHDRFVPFQHGEWLAAHVPGAEPHLSEVDGHLTLFVDRIPDVHRWLTGHLAG